MLNGAVPTSYPERPHRHAVALAASVNRTGTVSSTEVTNLSLDGCRISGFFMIGESVEIRIERIGLLVGKIRWAVNGAAGVRFLSAAANTREDHRLPAHEGGAAAIEYAVTAALIALCIVTALAFVGSGLANTLNSAAVGIPHTTQVNTA